MGSRDRHEMGLVTKAPNESQDVVTLGLGEKPSMPAAFISGLLKTRSRFMSS